MCSASGHGDLTGNASWELGELVVAPMLEVNGSKGPRGKGSTRGSGGKRRSSLMSAVLDALERDRTLWGACHVRCCICWHGSRTTYGREQRREMSSAMVLISSNNMVLRFLAASKMKDGALQLECCMSEVCLYAGRRGNVSDMYVCTSAGMIGREVNKPHSQEVYRISFKGEKQ